MANRKLENYVIKKTLDTNQAYDGCRNFLSYKVNGKEDKICIIMPFMDAGFNKVIGILVYCMIKSTSKMIRKKRAFSIDSKRTEKGVINQNKINNYLPTKQLLPSPMR